MERLQKVIAHAGVASRRKAEELITEGKVTVNGKVVTELGMKVGVHANIEVEGMPIVREMPVYYLFYKPQGVISSVADDKNRKVATDFFRGVKERIYPVGRLDYNTSGLLIMTNDGEFANLLMHPRYRIDKNYIAKVSPIPTKDELQQLERGVDIGERTTASARVKLLSGDRAKNTAIIELRIHEGRNRQIRRMFEAINKQVIKLKRERYGSLTLDGLNAGEYRPLTPYEVKSLRNLAESERK